MLKYTFVHKAYGQRYFDIHFETSVNAEDEQTTFCLPAWRPGRYQMSNFAQFIQFFKASDAQGNPLKVEKNSNHEWHVHTKGCTEVNIHYNFFANHLDAGSSFVSEGLFYVNPINCAIFPKNRMEESCSISIKVPPSFLIATSLTPASESGSNDFTAKDYHELVDSPFMASEEICHQNFEVGGVDFHLWFYINDVPDFEKIIQDFTAFTKAQLAVMKRFPVTTYHYLFLIPPFQVYHGVEHQKSTVITLGPSYNFKTDLPLYSSFLGISSHELFHTWNVKALRPIEMQPYDYLKENHSELGYVAEGVTSYYGDLFLLRSQCFDFKKYAQIFQKYLLRHFDNDGRHFKSVAASSIETWLDGYQKGSPARKTSIYVKGMLAAFILDMRLRSKNKQNTNLDHVMREMYEKYQKSGFSSADYQACIEELSGESFQHYFDEVIFGTQDLEAPLQEALGVIGLKMIFEKNPKTYERKLGFKITNTPSSLRISAIALESPAAEDGLIEGDEICNINRIKANKDNFDALVRHYTEAQSQLYFGLYRNDQYLEISVRPGNRNFCSLPTLVREPQVSFGAKKAFEAWSGMRYQEIIL